tara:strand:- start:541 stop:945 length:405 start_codon:yes stop_codon:yes gene_type:complete
MTNSNLTIEKIMRVSDSFPVLKPNSLVKEALDSMSEHGIGIVCVVGDESKLLGVITDGDLRRALLKNQKPFSAIFNDDIVNFTNKNIQSIGIDTSLNDAAKLFLEKKVWDLPVVDKENSLLGIVHLHEVVEMLL